MQRIQSQQLGRTGNGYTPAKQALDRVVEDAQGRTKETGLPAPAASQNLQQLTGDGTRKKTVSGISDEDRPVRLGREPQADSRVHEVPEGVKHQGVALALLCGHVNLPVVVLGHHLVQCLAGPACFGGGLVEVRETPQVEIVEVDHPQEALVSPHLRGGGRGIGTKLEAREKTRANG